MKLHVQFHAKAPDTNYGFAWSQTAVIASHGLPDKRSLIESTAIELLRGKNWRRVEITFRLW